MNALPSQPGLVAKLVSLVLAAGMLVLAFMFSLVLIPLMLLVGFSAFGYFYWKTRKLRQAMAEQMAVRSGESAQGDIIEGEAVVVREYGASAERRIEQRPERNAED